MLQTVFVLTALQLLGDSIAEACALPIPGTVIGLLLLLLVFQIRGRRLGRERAVPPACAGVAKTLHENFGLLFVPAGAGVVTTLDRIATDGLALLATVVLSTAITIAVTALIAARRPLPPRAACIPTAE